MQAIDQEIESQNEVVEEAQPEEQPPPEPPKTLAIAKEVLAAALKSFTARTSDLESTEKRLAAADREEEDLLEASNLSEEQQIERLSSNKAWTGHRYSCGSSKYRPQEHKPK